MARIDALDLARAMIACPSVTPEDGGAQKVLQDTLADLGFSCHSQTFSADNTPDVRNLYARLGSASPNFCFAGHTDVVPVGDPDSWQDDPFGAEVKDGVLYGRGASDMKTAIACFAEATSRFLANHGSDFGGSISFLITGDEEGPAINGTVKMLKWLEQNNQLPDVCIVGEPTNVDDIGDMVKIGRRGSINATLTVHGRQGHVAYPHLADNPVPRLIKMLAKLNAHELDIGNEFFQPSNLEIVTVDVGNEASNVIPMDASAKFNIRFNNEQSIDGLKKLIGDICEDVGGEYSLDINVSGDAFLTPQGPLSELIAGAIKQVTGREAELSTSGGTSDARFIKNYCPVIEFGLINKTIHKVNECVRIDDLLTLRDIYLMMLKNYFAK